MLIGYLDNHGGTVDRVVDPVNVQAGQLTAYDHRATTSRLSRCTGSPASPVTRHPVTENR